MAKIWYLGLLALASSTHSLSLHSRNDYAQCQSNPIFTCPTGSTCVPTTPQNSSVICCPTGSQCTLIQPLTCDISQQDVAKFPDNLIHTTNLTATLPACGQGCCPLGYDCQGGMCVMSSVPAPAPVTSAAQPPQSSTQSPSSSSTTTGPLPTAEPAAPAASSSSSPNLALALGLSFGLVGALAAILIILWCLKKRKQSKSSSYVNSVYRSRGANDSDTDFMGTTPRPPQIPASASFQRLQMHERKVSEPISHPDYNNGEPLHRTDFLLRRGSVETGWEDKVKPSWSTRSKYRPKSRLLLPSFRKSILSMPKTPDTGRLPVFSTPLRFGLPTTPKPADNRDIQSSRPPKGETNLARLVNLGGKTVPSGAGVRIENHTPPPSRAQTYEMKPHDRSESQRRPLVRNSSMERTGSPMARADAADTPDRGRSPPRSRSASDATTASFETGSVDDDDMKDFTDTKRVTMNVLLPPASVFKTPPPVSPKNRVRDDDDFEARGPKRATTFDDFIRRAH